MRERKKKNEIKISVVKMISHINFNDVDYHWIKFTWFHMGE